MARHRTALSAQERRSLVLRWAGRAAVWVLLGGVVGLAAWGALTWAGSLPTIRPWVGVAVGVLAAAAAGVADTVQVPPAPDEPGDPTPGPSPS